MRTLALSVALLLGLVATAEAQAFGPVNPSQLLFVAPTTNADGSPLQDLSGYSVRVAGPLAASVTTCPAFSTSAYAVKKSIPSSTTTPIANTTITFGTAGSTTLPGDLGLTVDGQYCAAVTAVDLTLNEGAASNTAPFGRNKLAPAAPAGLQVLP